LAACLIAELQAYRTKWQVIIRFAGALALNRVETTRPN